MPVDRVVAVFPANGSTILTFPPRSATMLNELMLPFFRLAEMSNAPSARSLGAYEPGSELPHYGPRGK